MTTPTSENLLAAQLLIYAQELKSVYEAERQQKSELAAAQSRLQELDLYRSNFVQLLSHELRTPITVMDGYIEILSELLEDRLSSSEQAYFQKTQQQVQQLSVLIRQLTDFHQFSSEANLAQLPASVVADCDLACIINSELKELAASFLTTQIELQLRLPSALALANIEPSRFRQITRYLLSNALKFNKQGGWISVGLRLETLAERTVTSNMQEQILALEIGNSGEIIPIDRRAFLFESFQQGEELATRHQGGLGIGLPIVRRMVTSLGGTIRVSSDENGTFFTVRLPYRLWEDPQQLKQKLQNLESYVITYAHDLRELYNAEREKRQRLAETNERLNLFLSRLLTAQEDERRRVSADLHDGVASQLTFAHQMLETVLAMSPELEKLPRFQTAKTALKDASQEIRRVIADLRPQALDQLGLVAALREYLEEMAKENNWNIRYEHSQELDGSEISILSRTIEDSVFRITQEALTNVRKHSHSVHVMVSLMYEEKCLVLNVGNWESAANPSVSNLTEFAKTLDTNSPLDASLPDSDNITTDTIKFNKRLQHFGLTGMRERVELLGGTFKFLSKANVGALVTAVIPLL